jgi:hypothetical protein
MYRISWTESTWNWHAVCWFVPPPEKKEIRWKTRERDRERVILPSLKMHLWLIHSDTREIETLISISGSHSWVRNNIVKKWCKMIIDIEMMMHNGVLSVEQVLHYLAISFFYSQFYFLQFTLNNNTYIYSTFWAFHSPLSFSE